jgi:hypothetical protein
MCRVCSQRNGEKDPLEARQDIILDGTALQQSLGGWMSQGPVAWWGKGRHGHVLFQVQGPGISPEPQGQGQKEGQVKKTAMEVMLKSIENILFLTTLTVLVVLQMYGLIPMLFFPKCDIYHSQN